MSLLNHRNRSEKDENDDMLDDDRNSARQHMAALNSQNYLKQSLEPNDSTTPI
jgi:hypothetical protein